MKILVSAISFINRAKPGAEIYATFANRLIDDVLTKTPWDVRIATNEPELFQDSLEKSSRVSVLVDKLENNKVYLGAFNQLLKYFALKDIPEEYDWVLYLDCDAGFRKEVDEQEVIEHIQRWEEQGYDAIAVRTNAIVRRELEDHETRMAELNKLIADGVPNPYVPLNLFSVKFNFYNVTSENINPVWLDASMPSEHFLLLKNIPGKIQKMSDSISDFNKIFIAQPGPYIVISDMEAFELGISAAVAGFKFGDAGDYGHNWALSIDFNGNNWERIKL